jgi:phage terminase small subunit
MPAIRKQKPARPSRRDLERYRRFVEAYLDVGQPTYFNSVKSAKAAGYSDSYAHGRSYELLDRVRVREEMRRLRDERAGKSTIAGPIEVLEILSAQLRTLPNKLYSEDGSLIPIHKMTDKQAHAVAGVKATRRTKASGNGTITEISINYKLVDRTRTAELLAKHHGLFEKDNQQSKPDLTPLRLVAMPSGDLTLEEWTRQAQVILNVGKTEQLQKCDCLKTKRPDD